MTMTMTYITYILTGTSTHFDQYLDYTLTLNYVVISELDPSSTLTVT